MKKLYAILLFQSTLLVALAQEVSSNYEFHGFSNDLKLAILEVYAEGAIEDDPASTRFIFVDVDKNDYAMNVVKFTGKDGQGIDDVRKMGRKQAQPYFSKFNVAGNNPGVQIPLNIESEEDAENLIFRFNGVDYKLVLKSVPTGEMLLELYEKKKMDMYIVHDSKTQILQRDKVVAASRGFAVSYSIKAAYLNQNKIAVVVEYGVAPGFEGYMDKYQMLVTGALN